MKTIAVLGRKIKKPEEKKMVCRECGKDCGDKVSLTNHIKWRHPTIIYLRQY
jgi:hypothetical protein